MAPKDEPRPDSAGEGDDDGGIDLGALVARLEQVEETQQVIEDRQRTIVRALTRGSEFVMGEMEHLLD